MNNIYVNGELPKSCQQCPYYSYEETEDEFWEFCSWCGYEFSEETCPLKPLSDRLAEERKKVVQELKQRLIEYTGFDEEYLKEHIFDVDAGCLLKQIDKFERGE